MAKNIHNMAEAEYVNSKFIKYPNLSDKDNETANEFTMEAFDLTSGVVGNEIGFIFGLILYILIGLPVQIFFTVKNLLYSFKSNK